MCSERPPASALPYPKARYCQPHHVHWWRRQGLTDLDNLLPLCSRHHHCVHEGGWVLVLQPDHSFTITYPDETVEEVPTPGHRRRAAGQSQRNRREAATGATTAHTVSTSHDRAASAARGR